MVLDRFGAASEFQRRRGFVQDGRRDVADDGRARVATERGSQNVRQFTIAEVDEALAVAELFDHQRQRRQTRVDGAAFAEPVASRVGLRGLLRAGQVHCNDQFDKSE